jgi:hypothetical protein
MFRLLASFADESELFSACAIALSNTISNLDTISNLAVLNLELMLSIQASLRPPLSTAWLYQAHLRSLMMGTLTFRNQFRIAAAFQLLFSAKLGLSARDALFKVLTYCLREDIVSTCGSFRPLR